MTEQQRRLSGGPSSAIPPINTTNSDPKRWGPTPPNGDRRDYELSEPPPSQSQMMHQQYSPPHSHGPPHHSPGPESSYKKQQNRSPPQHPPMYQGNKQQMRSPPQPHHHPGMYPPHPGHPPPYMSHPSQHGYHPPMPHQHPHHPGPPHHGYNMPPPQMYPQWQPHPYPSQMPHGPPHHGYHPSQPHPYSMQHQPQPPQRKKSSSQQDEKKETSPEAKKSPSPSPTKEESPKKEPLPLKVSAMRPDFHFYVHDHQEKVKEEAKLEVLGHLSLKDKEEEIDPYLLFTNMNERLISMWEKAPQATRTAYLVKEEEDRKRFMNAEEVASQHCATLTARAKSPAFVKRGGDGSSPDKKMEDGSDFTEEMDTEPEGKNKPKSRSSSQVSIESADLSPTKKNRIDPKPLTMKEMYGDYEFMPQHSDLSSKELLEMAERIPREAHENSQDKARDLEVLEEEREKFKKAAEEARQKEQQIVKEDEDKATHQLQEITKTHSKESDETKSTCPEDVSHDSDKEDLSSSEDDDADEDMEESYEVESLLDRRTRQVRGRKVKEYLVRWKGFGSEADSWEPLKNVSHCEEQVKAIDKKKKMEDREKKGIKKSKPV